MHAADSRGRRYPEPGHRYRSAYARDRDRIIHSRAFRRLEAKTQVFTMRYSDHFRNRLTHTIEVSQIARTVALALGANTELAEALALVHDIGHPPFGHAGERRLDELMRSYGGSFNHNLHALRIVDQFEQRYLDFPGLNLTFEVREGIVKHSRDYPPAQFPALAEFLLELRPPLEAQLIDCVDEIAYNTADLDDAREAGLLDVGRLRPDDIRRAPKRLAGFSEAAARATAQLKRFLFSHIYNHPAITEDRDRSVECLGELFEFYLSSAHSMPAQYEELVESTPRHIVVCDYIAGMTDQFLLRQHQEKFGG
jgi:dGTPase